MDLMDEWPEAGVHKPQTTAARSRWPWLAGLCAVALIGAASFGFWQRETGSTAQAAVPPAPVTVSQPLAARRRHPDRLPRPVLGGGPRRVARPGRRHADRDPFQGWADRPQGRSALHHRSDAPTRSSSPRRARSSQTAQSRLTLANSAAHSRPDPEAQPISAPPRTSTSARPSRRAPRPRSTTPRPRSATLGSTSSIAASSRLSPAASARIRSRSAAWSPAAAPPAAPRPCSRRSSRSIRSISTST